MAKGRSLFFAKTSRSEGPTRGIKVSKVASQPTSAVLHVQQTNQAVGKATNRTT